MGNQFYYTNAANEVIGPCTTLQLMALQKSGELNDSSMVCAEGSDQWVEMWSVFPAARLLKSDKSAAAAQGAAAAPAVPPPPPVAESPAPKPTTTRPATSAQAAVIILLLAVGLALPYISPLRPIPKWEYKKVIFPSDGNERVGPGALRYSTIHMDEKLLSQLGAEGWEMVGSYMEMETAFPNLGKEDLTTGVQPNIRPQSLTVLFKRPAR